MQHSFRIAQGAPSFRVLRSVASRLSAALPSLPSVPVGWVSFSLRTWIAVVLALAAAFWLELSSASSAAVCVAILAQPTRGQALSKGVYRMGGTVIGAAMALLLVALFPQNRFMLLGGVALWIALCTLFGSLTRDFRAYAAVLSGYTVAIVGLSVIDEPNMAFDEAVGRVAVIAIGVLAVTLVNDVFGSPEVWSRLPGTLRTQAGKVFAIADDVLAGGTLPDDTELAALGADILSLRSQASFARMELEDGRRRMSGAESAMLALLDMLRCARAIAHAPDPHAGSSEPAGVFMAERRDALIRHRHLAEDGMATLAEGRSPARHVRMRIHLDLFAAGLNATRVLIAFTFGAGICVLSGLSDSTAALIQISAMCALVATNPNPTSFARGVLVGVMLAIVSAGVIEFGLLTHGSALPLLAIALLPLVFLGCLLSMIPRTASAGFIMLVFTLVMLSPANMQGFDPTSFAEQAVMLSTAAVVIFLSLTLILPVSPRRRLLRGALSIAEELARAFDAPLSPDAPGEASRQYDRLAQLHQWNAKIGSADRRRFVLKRLVGLTDLIAALGRARLALAALAGVPALQATASGIARGLRPRDVEGTLHSLEEGARNLLAAGPGLSPEQDRIVQRAVSGLYGAAMLLRANRRMLLLAGALGARGLR